MNQHLFAESKLAPKDYIDAFLMEGAEVKQFLSFPIITTFPQQSFVLKRFIIFNVCLILQVRVSKLKNKSLEFSLKYTCLQEIDL